MKSKIRTLLIGLGRIGWTLEKDPLRYHPCTHAGVLLSEFGKKKFTLSALLDVDQEKISEFTRFWKLDQKNLILQSGQIANSDIQFAVIATNSGSHFKIAKFCLESGIRYLLIEKPACLTLSEINELLKLKKKYKACIWVNHERRYHPAYRYVKRLIDSGQIGKVKSIRASVLTSVALPGNAYKKDSVGALLHDGTHAIDYIQWLFGKPKKVFSRDISGTPDRVIALLEYPQGLNIFFETGGFGNYFQFEIDILSTEARVILSNDGHTFFRSKKSGLYKGFQSLKSEKFPVFPNRIQNPWINLYSEIAACISEGTGTVTGPIEDSREILEIIEQIQVSQKNSLHLSINK
ncbi:MAG: Gfo/Idh/MocA family oxidoreductase [Leptospira sp.]|nr:Gfo/Idh/MocA family oxidoreductase [Leptospira sp.]